MTAQLTVEDLHIATSDGLTRVHGASFSVGRGRSLGIVGESGSGKTLTCRAILGILASGVHIQEGSIKFEGKELTSLGSRQWREIWGKRFGAVFQDPATYLNPAIPVGRQVAEPLRVVAGLSGKEARTRTIELFRSVGLRSPERVAKSFVHELSGGMLQRVLIAIAVSNDPDLLIADEATTALDVTVQAEVLDVIQKLRDERDLALLLVSHDLAVVSQMCEQIVVFKDGHIVESGETQTVLRHPRHDYTRRLVSNQLAGSLEREESTLR